MNPTLSDVFQAMCDAGHNKEIHLPLMYAAITGSQSYGLSTEGSDFDVVLVYYPKKEELFVTEQTYIPGWTTIPKEPKDHQFHHLKWKDTKIDVKFYPFPKFIRLAVNGNPNIIDLLHTPEELVLFRDRHGEILRLNKDKLVSKEMVARYIGMMKNHMKPLTTKYDAKDASHVVRAGFQCLEAIISGRMTLGQNTDLILKIKNGIFSQEQSLRVVKNTVEAIALLGENCTLPDKPDENYFELFLKDVLHVHY